jgi:steroid delta-isomerase-like uncharacterized protein
MNMQKLLLAGSVIAILAIVGPLSSRVDADDTAIAQAWIDAWNSHNPDTVIALFAKHAVLEDVTFGAVSHGLTEIRKFAADNFTAIPDIHFELVNSTLKGGHGTIEWVFSGTDTGIFGGTRKPFSVRGVTVMDVHGTKLTRETDYWDLATVLREIDLL